MLTETGGHYQREGFKEKSKFTMSSPDQAFYIQIYCYWYSAVVGITVNSFTSEKKLKSV